MKNFDLEAAKRGAAVCTKCVMDVRIIYFDRIDSLYPIVGLCRNNDGSEFVESYTTDGRRFCSTTDDRDLMMRDDDYLEKLERGEYYIEDKREIVDPTIKQNLNTDREYWRRVYAGQAMQGIVSALDMDASIAEDGVADKACAFADALIEELEKDEKVL
jgi:hypothetical protein